MLKADESALSSYDPFSLQPQIVTIGMVMLIILTIYIIYYVKLKKVPVNRSPAGFVLMIQIYVEYVRNLVVDVMGKKMEKLTPFFIFLFSYLIIGNMIDMIGLESPTASLTVTLSFGLVMFIGTFVIGFRYQKLSYLTRFTFNYTSKKSGKTFPLMVNPLSFTDVIAPLISISFRLWGNIFAGGMIVTLWFYFTGYILNQFPAIALINLLGGLTAPPIHAYFDLLCGLIQALVFTLLTMVYWTLAKEHGSYDEDGNLKNKPLPQIKNELNLS